MNLGGIESRYSCSDQAPYNFLRKLSSTALCQFDLVFLKSDELTMVGINNTSQLLSSSEVFQWFLSSKTVACLRVCVVSHHNSQSIFFDLVIFFTPISTRGRGHMGRNRDHNYRGRIVKNVRLSNIMCCFVV